MRCQNKSITDHGNFQNIGLGSPVYNHNMKSRLISVTLLDSWLRIRFISTGNQPNDYFCDIANSWTHTLFSIHFQIEYSKYRIQFLKEIISHNQLSQ